MPPSTSRRRFSASVSWDGIYQEGPVHRGRRRRRNTSSAVACTHSSAGEHALQSSDDPESSHSRDDSFLDSPSTIPLIYASLPPTPITPSESPTSPTFPETASPALSPPFSDAPFSLWDYLREELLATDFDSHQELKWERVSNFLSIPLAMEKACLLRFYIATDFHLCAYADNRFWFHPLLRLISLHFHHTAHSLFPRIPAFRRPITLLLALFSTYSRISKGRHPANGSLSLLCSNTHPSN
jgi:hypothetical protein